jgi:dTMP kinase
VSDRGRFLVLEGIDGCGKTTQVDRLVVARDAYASFEPGGTELGQSLRSLLLRTGEPPVSMAEAMMMAADRAQHVATVIEPILATGVDVISDRHSASTIAYQGYGRGIDLGALETLNLLATQGLVADLTVLLDLPVELAAERRRGNDPDRLESLADGFFERVRAGYLELAAAQPHRWVVVDATRTPDEVATAIAEALAERGL